MTDIKLAEIGFIEDGEDKGSYIVVQDDRARTGGYLIFYSKSPDFDDEVFDHWAENGKFLGRMLADSRIHWLGVPLFLHPAYNRPVPVDEVVPKPRIGVKGMQEIRVRRGLSKIVDVEQRYVLVQEDPARPQQYVVYTSPSPEFDGDVRQDRVEGDEALHRYLAGGFPKSFRWIEET